MNYIGLIIALALLGLAIKISLDSGYEDIPVLINVIKKEIIVCLPVALLMLGYQIYKSGCWAPSPETTDYIEVFINLEGILPILMYKYSKNRKILDSKFISGLCLGIVLIPTSTIGMLIIRVFGIK